LDIQRSALIIATNVYQDPGLTQLRAPAGDAEELALVLRDPEIGNFEVQTILNEPAHIISEAIEEFFADRRRDDLLALHISCHGVKSDNGELYFAATNTKLRRLGATAVSANFVNSQMNRSRSRRIVLFLDCCYSGAFERGMIPRAAVGVDIHEQLGGRGRAVITASSAMEFAFERDTGELAKIGQTSGSVFTSAIVEGLRTGEADIDQDGPISLGELYDYVYDKVRQTTTSQTPNKWIFGMEGELYIARRRGAITLPSELPGELQQALEHPFPRIRVGVVEELERFLTGRHAGLALAAKLTLERLVAEDDSRMVIDAATAALNALPRLEVSATQVNFGHLALGAEPPRRTVSVRNTGGGDLKITAAASDKRLSIEVTGDELTIIPDTSTSGELRGQVLVQSNGGSLTIGVVAVIEPQPILSVRPKELDFGRLAVGEHQAARRIEISNEDGGNLVWDYRVEGEFLDVTRDDNALVVQPRPLEGRHSGAIFIRSNGGEEALRVMAVIEDGTAPAQEEPSGTDALSQPSEDKDIDMVMRSSPREQRPSVLRASAVRSAIPRLRSKSGIRILIVVSIILGLLAWSVVSLRDRDQNRNRAGGPSVTGLVDPLNLRGVCPATIVVQTDWFPKSEYGVYYHLIGSKPKIDTARQRVSGPLVADGTDTGVRLEVRSGRPATGSKLVSSQMYEDKSITLGLVNTDEAVRFSGTQPTLGVVAPMEISPFMIMWDPQAYPQFRSIADIGQTDVKVSYSQGDSYMQYLIGSDILRRSQVKASYDGTPAEFIASQGKIAQTGSATSEPYIYEQELPQWNKPVRYAMVKDIGYPLYPEELAIRVGDKGLLAPCLKKLVPIVQRAQIDYLQHPQKANQLIVDLVKKYITGWQYDLGLANYAIGKMRADFVNNGPDNTLGNFESSRVQRIIDIVSPILASQRQPAKQGLKPEELVTNEFIDRSIGVT
jgi:hypothetical protein